MLLVNFTALSSAEERWTSFGIFSPINLFRCQVLNQLESGTLQLVVCSDALARGIDVDGLDGVISYDAPTHLKT